MFALSNAFQNDMTWAGSTKNHGGDIFQGKGLDEGQGLPSRDWTGVLPTQMFLNSNLVTPENFVQFCQSIQKLFMIFLYHRCTDRRTETQTPYKTIHPTTLYRYRQMEWGCFCLLTLFCWDKIIFTNYIIWRLFKTFNHKCVRYKIGWSSRFEYPMIYNSSKSELWLLFVPVIPVFLIPSSNPRRFKKRVSHYTLHSIKYTGLVNKNSTFHFTKTKHQATAKLCQSFVPAELI